MFLPQRTDLPVAVKIVSAAMVFIGTVGAIAALRHLGRSFSILPEGRKLVRSGPYRIIRHPVYLTEALSTLGAMIIFLSPEAAALVIAQFLLQLGRIHYEERVLRATFPEYADYARRTWRLIPGLY
jgi:protein-S-isoprenylcysteine O-methyltransferase Ste14